MFSKNCFQKTKLVNAQEAMTGIPFTPTLVWLFWNGLRRIAWHGVFESLSKRQRRLYWQDTTNGEKHSKITLQSLVMTLTAGLFVILTWMCDLMLYARRLFQKLLIQQANLTLSSLRYQTYSSFPICSTLFEKQSPKWIYFIPLGFSCCFVKWTLEI